MNWRKLLLSPQGRIGRQSFWIWIAVSYAAALVAATVDVTIFGLEADVSPFSSLIGLATLYPSFCVNVKRLHDTNRSGWWMLAPTGLLILAVLVAIPLIPSIDETSSADKGAAYGALIALLVLGLVVLGAFITLIVWVGFRKGAPGPNKYGEPNSGDREVTPVVEVFS